MQIRLGFSAALYTKTLSVSPCLSSVASFAILRKERCIGKAIASWRSRSRIEEQARNHNGKLFVLHFAKWWRWISKVKRKISPKLLLCRFLIGKGIYKWSFVLCDNWMNFASVCMCILTLIDGERRLSRYGIGDTTFGHAFVRCIITSRTYRFDSQHGNAIRLDHRVARLGTWKRKGKNNLMVTHYW